MRELWSTELTEEEIERLLKSTAREIKRRKLEVPAVLFMEMHKPLAYVGSQAGIVFSPFLVPLFGFNNVNDFTRLFSKRENFERLIRLLEGTDAIDDETINASVPGDDTGSRSESVE